MRTAALRFMMGGIALSAACSRDSGRSSATGTIELTQTDVAATVAAQVLRVVVDEGEWVKRGDTLVLLSQSTLPGDIEQRRARLAAAEAELRDLLAGARQPELDRASAELASAESEAERTAREAERLQRLADAGGISQSQLEAALTAARVATARRDATREALQLLQQGSRPERIRAARAAVASARGTLAMAEAVAADLVLTAPADGVVLSRLVEPGEVLAAGIPAISLGDPRRPWIRVYVSAPALAAIRLGQRAEVTLEGVRDRVFEGRVVAISPQAEFTPRVAMTESERADLLFGVKLDLADTTGALKAGLPATVVFDTVAVVRPE
ncbi:MAG TPA: HlyD family efflux transporter periplasmic adaptor subunit [Gemmatimonadaceae bacterium]|nr:HlyD family efflux transporter periplasmic adaptor subunit [Gemmatimonadaceae bacterium]